MVALHKDNVQPICT